MRTLACYILALTLTGCRFTPPPVDPQPCERCAIIDEITAWADTNYVYNYRVAIERDAINQRWNVQIFRPYHWGRDCISFPCAMFAALSPSLADAWDEVLGNYTAAKERDAR